MSANLFSLRGKTAIVTGGTRGIGQAIAIGLAEAGADIILVQRDPTTTATRDAILGLHRRCEIILADLSSPQQVASIFPQLLLNLSPPIHLPQTDGSMEVDQGTSPNAVSTPIPNNQIDILVNAAGIQSRHPSAEFPLEVFEKVLQTNLTSAFVLCRDIGRYWLERGVKGSILNIGSLLQYQGGLTVVAYTASKGAIAQLTKGLSNEWANKGIRVNAIAPGYVATEMNTALMNDSIRSRQIMERIPAQRWGSPEDFKGPAVFLCSGAAQYVTGETLVVDGGWMAR